MKKFISLLAFMLALAVAYAAPQTSPTTPTNQPSGQVKPPNPDGAQGQTTPPAGAQTGAQPQGATSPQDAQSQIQRALNNDPNLHSDAILVSVQGNDLDLTGDVASDQEKDAAKKIAEKYAGSMRVRDHLKVRGSAPGPNSKPPGNALGSISGNANGGVADLQAAAGETSPSPSELQAQIQNALRNEPTLASDNVNVTVSEDEINVAGAVATAKEKLTAKRIVQSYAGNRKVKDQLTLKGRGVETSNPQKP